MSDIVVLGSANMDMVVRQPRMARPGETIFGRDFTTFPGGKGLNQAVAAARAGASVAFIGAVGRDLYGQALRDVLIGEGIDVTALADSPLATGTAHVSVVEGGENSIVVVSGANETVMELTEAGREAIESARYLVMQFELPQQVVLAAARVARLAGVATVLTPSPVQPVLPELLSLIDILVANESEALGLAGGDDSANAARQLSEAGGTVIVTQGGRGAIVASGGGLVSEVPARVVRAVDTTAAGDAFVGVLIGRLAAGHQLEGALTAASAAASISVTRPGASTSMPTLAEIEAALAE